MIVTTMDNNTEETNLRTRYGSILILIQDKEIFLSRRLDTPRYSKKWQFPNTLMKVDVAESPTQAAIRLGWEEFGLSLKSDDLYQVSSVDMHEINQFYYVFLVNVPLHNKIVHGTSDTKTRSGWRPFELDHARILDLAPKLREIVEKLEKTLMIAEKASTSIDKTKTQVIPRIGFKQESAEDMVQGCCGV